MLDGGEGREQILVGERGSGIADLEPGRRDDPGFPVDQRAVAVEREDVEVLVPRRPYSHSIVPGGFEEMSRATRFTPATSLMTRLEMRSSRS